MCSKQEDYIFPEGNLIIQNKFPTRMFIWKYQAWTLFEECHFRPIPTMTKISITMITFHPEMPISTQIGNPVAVIGNDVKQALDIVAVFPVVLQIGDFRLQ